MDTKRTQLHIIVGFLVLLCGYALMASYDNENVIEIDTELKITSVTTINQLKSPPGRGRLGWFCHGSFIGYSFGNAYPVEANEEKRIEGGTEFIELPRRILYSNQIPYELNPYKSVSLLLEKSSRKLARVDLYSKEMSLAEIKTVVGRMKDKIAYDFALIMSRTQTKDVNHNNNKSHLLFLLGAEDTEFMARLFVYSLPNSMAYIIVSVTSKKVVNNSDAQFEKLLHDSDIRVDTGDL